MYRELYSVVLFSVYACIYIFFHVFSLLRWSVLPGCALREEEMKGHNDD